MEIKAYPKVGERLYTEVLPNGLTVYYLPKPDYHKTYGLLTTQFGSLDTQFVVPGESDMQTFPEGIAHFLEHKLFDKPHGDIFDDFGRLGATSNAFTTFNRTSYLFATSEHVEACTEILLDFVQDAYFTEASVAKEQGIIKQEIQMYQDDADWRLFFGLLQALYPDSPLASDIAGTPESIASITPEALYTNHATFYQPSNMCLFLTGNFDVKQLSQLVRKNQAKKSYQAPYPIQRSAFEAGEPKQGLELQLDVARPKLALGFRGYDNLPQDPVARARYKLALTLGFDMLLGETSDRYANWYQAGLIDDSFHLAFELFESCHFLAITMDTDDGEIISKQLQDVLKNYKIEGSLTSEHFDLLKKEQLGDYYASLNSLEYIANQFAASMDQTVTFFDLPDLLDSLSLDQVMATLEAFISEMQVASYQILPLSDQN